MLLLHKLSVQKVRMTEAIQTIPFDEILSGAIFRFTVIDGVQYLSVSDLLGGTHALESIVACVVAARKDVEAVEVVEAISKASERSENVLCSRLINFAPPSALVSFDQ